MIVGSKWDRKFKIEPNKEDSTLRAIEGSDIISRTIEGISPFFLSLTK
jgi:hypothetical protein